MPPWWMENLKMDKNGGKICKSLNKARLNYIKSSFNKLLQNSRIISVTCMQLFAQYFMNTCNFAQILLL